MPHRYIIAPSLPLFHALTGCDTVSSMLGIAKKKAWTCWKRNVKNFCQTFISLNLASSFTSIYQLQEFVVALYVKKRVANDIDECRYQLYASGNSFDKLPPTSSALNKTRRSIYQAEEWRICLKRKQNLPSPLDWGWELTESGELKPIWTIEAPVTSVNVLVSHCNCKSFCSFCCACKSRSIKCTGLCSCGSKNCYTVNARSDAMEAAPSQRNVFDFLEALQ